MGEGAITNSMSSDSTKTCMSVAPLSRNSILKIPHLSVILHWGPNLSVGFDKNKPQDVAVPM